MIENFLKTYIIIFPDYFCQKKDSLSPICKIFCRSNNRRAWISRNDRVSTINQSRGQRGSVAAKVEGRRALTPFTLFKCESACMNNDRVYVHRGMWSTHDHNLEVEGRGSWSCAINFAIDFQIPASGKRLAVNDLPTGITNTPMCCVTLNTGIRADKPMKISLIKHRLTCIDPLQRVRALCINMHLIKRPVATRFSIFSLFCRASLQNNYG